MLSEGLKSLKGFAEAGLEHARKVTGGRRPHDGKFKWMERLARAALTTKPAPYREIIAIPDYADSSAMFFLSCH